MADPVFTNKADLEKWAAARAQSCWPYDHKTMLKAVDEVKRVTLAHAHLLEGN